MKLRLLEINRILMLVAIMAVTLVGGTAAVSVPLDPSPKLIIMIMLDGFRPDYLTMYSPENLRRLVSDGAWVAESRSVFPANTTPNQMSLVTGSLPMTTGIPNNSRYDRATDQILSPLRDNKAATIAEVASAAGWRTVAVNHFAVQGRGAQRYLRGNINTVISAIDDGLPALIVYYNVTTDSVGHKSGPFSNAMREAVTDADAEIGKLLEALDAKGLTDETVLVVASDHGMSLYDGEPISPSVTEIAINNGLKFATDNSQIKEDTDLVVIPVGSLFLYWRPGMKTPQKEQALLNAFRAAEGAEVLIAPDIVKLGADPERLGDLVIAPQEGYAIARGSGTGGIHGTPNEAHNLMLFWGTGIKPGSIVHRASIVDIVPTLLTLAKLEMPETVDGEPLYSILDRTGWKYRLGVAGDYKVQDVAVSSSAFLSLPVNVADGYTSTVWQTEGAVGEEPEFLLLDFGSPKRISSVELVADSGSAVTSPQNVALAVSIDGQSYQDVFTGQLPPAKEGASQWMQLKAPVRGEYLRLTINSGWSDVSGVRIAEVHVWAEGRPQEGSNDMSESGGD